MVSISFIMYAGHLYDVLGIQNIDYAEKKLERKLFEGAKSLEKTLFRVNKNCHVKSKRTGKQECRTKKAHAEVEVKNQWKSHFIAVLRHAFRSPLNMIIGYSTSFQEKIAKK